MWLNPLCRFTINHVNCCMATGIACPYLPWYPEVVGASRLFYPIFMMASAIPPVLIIILWMCLTCSNELPCDRAMPW